jgi:ribosomal protein L37AE/L43A
MSIPYGDWMDVGRLNYAGVIWIVRAPKPPWHQLDAEPISVDDLELQTPPRCPKCETEIEQTQSFWGGYIWKCVRCGFKKRNSESYYREEERAKKIARREFEIHLSQAKHT